MLRSVVSAVLNNGTSLGDFSSMYTLQDFEAMLKTVPQVSSNGAVYVMTYEGTLIASKIGGTVSVTKDTPINATKSTTVCPVVHAHCLSGGGNGVVGPAATGDSCVSRRTPNTPAHSLQSPKSTAMERCSLFSASMFSTGIPHVASTNAENAENGWCLKRAVLPVHDVLQRGGRWGRLLAPMASPGSSCQALPQHVGYTSQEFHREFSNKKEPGNIFDPCEACWRPGTSMGVEGQLSHSHLPNILWEVMSMMSS